LYLLLYRDAALLSTYVNSNRVHRPSVIDRIFSFLAYPNIQIGQATAKRPVDTPGDSRKNGNVLTPREE